MALNAHWILLFAGTIAGFIDSIAGGGGLITIPTLSLFLTMGPDTIGTNKIAGTISALLALGVYTSKGHMKWREGWLFTFFIGLGSFLGSVLNPYLPLVVFHCLLLLTCPPILWIIWKKELWIQRERSHLKPSKEILKISILGFACGFYDGIWGPGGGTFMFLSLFFIAKLPLFTALAISKLANMTSAGVSLINFARHDYVHWDLGFWLSAGIALGAITGSLTASQKSTTVIRPALVVVVSLLLAKVLFY